MWSTHCDSKRIVQGLHMHEKYKGKQSPSLNSTNLSIIFSSHPYKAPEIVVHYTEWPLWIKAQNRAYSNAKWWVRDKHKRKSSSGTHTKADSKPHRVTSTLRLTQITQKSSVYATPEGIWLCFISPGQLTDFYLSSTKWTLYGLSFFSHVSVKTVERQQWHLYCKQSRRTCPNTAYPYHWGNEIMQCLCVCKSLYLVIFLSNMCVCVCFL